VPFPLPKDANLRIFLLGNHHGADSSSTPAFINPPRWFFHPSFSFNFSQPHQYASPLFTMASSSSSSSYSVLSYESETTREATPEFNPMTAYEACAPLHWDAEEWDFQAWSEDDESLTDGEDLQFFLDEELDEEDNDDDS
jgi:hypothetical protein